MKTIEEYPWDALSTVQVIEFPDCLAVTAPVDHDVLRDVVEIWRKYRRDDNLENLVSYMLKVPCVISVMEEHGKDVPLPCTYNIEPSVWGYAKRKGLEGYATGGGCDHIGRSYEGMLILVVDAEDSGAPDSLDCPSIVMIVKEDDWNTAFWFPINGPSPCREAIDLVSSIETQSQPKGI